MFAKEEGLQKPVPSVARVVGVEGPLEPPSCGRAYGRRQCSEGRRCSTCKRFLSVKYVVLWS